MKNSAELGGRYRPRPSASLDNALLDLQNSSYRTRPHSIIAKCPRTNIVANGGYLCIFAQLGEGRHCASEVGKAA